MSKTKLKLLLLLVFPLGFILSTLFERNPYSWESWYSMGINKWLIIAISHVFGIFPFSFFEIGIYAAFIGLIVYIAYTLLHIFKNFKGTLKILAQFILSLLATLSVLYITFLTFWGLNYNRPHFSDKYGIQINTYTPEQLGDLYAHMLNQAAIIRPQLSDDENGTMVPFTNYKGIFERAQLGFDVVSIEFPTLEGNYGDAKPIIASELMNYTGITGIYSPFTGEPNVNISVPAVTIPATTCHEMAHQRGYGFENECNFIAYITCLAHPDLDFQYSGLIMGISYTSNALAMVDLERLQSLNATMHPQVYHDLVAISQFWDQYEGEIKEVAEEVNDTYLKSNGVTEGTASYGEMVDLLLALYDKYH